MHNQLHFRYFLFACLVGAFAFFSPTASISQTASTPRVPCPAVTGHPLPVLPSPVIPSQRPSMSAASHVKGAKPQSGQLYNSGDPSVDEQYYLELLNAARMNPPAAGVGISNTTDPNVSFEFTYWAGQDANEPTRAKIKSDFANYQPKQPLAMNASLLTAARAHSQDMLDNNYQGHQGTDGSWPWDRAQKAGYPSLGGGGSPYVGENAAAYANTVYDAYAGWLIDFGVPNDTEFGHRNNCLEYKTGSDTINPGYTECGPGMIPDPGEGYPTHTGPLVSTLDLGDAGKHFILGVVYNDQNNNGLYDPGEGDSGITITASSASYYAVSSGAGGYAIPFSGSGTVTVTATDPTHTVFPTPVTKTIDFEGQNVKVDFSPDLSGYPTQVALLSPINDTIVNTQSIDFVWDTMALATSYHIEIATDSLMKKLVWNDSNLKPPSFAFNTLKDSSTYFWRVQAKNAKGVGGWSAVASFSIALPPSPVVLISPANNSSVPDSAVNFTWQAANKGGFFYYLIVASDKLMKDTIFSDSTNFDTSESLDVTNFQVGQTYYWEVLAENDNGWSNPGTIWNFTTATSSVSLPIASSSSIVTISPNPSSGSAEINFAIPTSEDVSLRVFNSLGQQVQSVDLGRFSAGSNSYVWDASGLPAGSYACQLRMGDHIENARVVILK